MGQQHESVGVQIYLLRHVSLLGIKKLVTACRTRNQFLFEVEFGTHVYFQSTLHCAKNLVDFFTLINASLCFQH